jgi:putative NIF3 family GTP cyclohydrolase 1 type 2
VIDQLGWQTYQDKTAPRRITLPTTTLEALILHLKKGLGISTVRYIGNLSQSCQKVLLMPGAYGGRNHIEAIGKEQPDVAIVGELQEWETAEYVRDARAKGQKLSLVVLGHTDSEEPGAAFMASWLQKHVPDVKVTHIPSGNPLQFL